MRIRKHRSIWPRTKKYHAICYNFFRMYTQPLPNWWIYLNGWTNSDVRTASTRSNGKQKTNVFHAKSIYCVRGCSHTTYVCGFLEWRCYELAKTTSTYLNNNLIWRWHEKYVLQESILSEQEERGWVIRISCYASAVRWVCLCVCS